MAAPFFDAPGETVFAETVFAETETVFAEAVFGETPFGETPFAETPFAGTPFAEDVPVAAGCPAFVFGAVLSTRGFALGAGAAPAVDPPP